MNESNQQTLQSYEAHVQEYVEGTPHEVSGSAKEWIDRMLEGLPKDAKIIEIGSAFGRDAKYIEEQGYVVERTDATHGFVQLLRQEGYAARDFNLLTDNFDMQYDIVFADAVLLHFTKEEVALALRKVHDALAEEGRFVFSLKEGEGEEWSEGKLGAPRYFRYWNEPDIRDELVRVGFSDVAISTGIFGNNDQKWLHIIATK